MVVGMNTADRVGFAGLPWVLVAMACGGSTPPAASSVRTPVTSAPMIVDTATIEVPQRYLGQVYVEHDVVVAARSAGVIDSLVVHLGTGVRAGALLATIDSRDQDIARARATMRAQYARNAVRRSRELTHSGGVTVVDSEQVEFDLQQAELELRSADRAYELTRLLAPVSGVVTARYAKPRQLVAVGDTLFRVAATAPQLVRIRVPEPAARRVRLGGKAVVVSASGGARHTARVVFASPALEPASGTREVILQLASPGFMVGESVDVEMGSASRLAVVAPREAIDPDNYALVFEGDRSTLRPVTVGALVSGGRVEIASGLAVGERLAPLRR